MSREAPVRFCEKLGVKFPLLTRLVVHCKTERQARYLLNEIRQRFTNCKLKVHDGKTKIVNIRGSSEQKYQKSFDFLGFTIEPHYTKVKGGEKRILPRCVISKKSVSGVLEKFRHIHKRRVSIEVLAQELNPMIRGVMNYYCKFWSSHTYPLWNQLNKRLKKWVKVGEGFVHVCIDSLASAEISSSSRFIRTLEIGTSIKIKYLGDQTGRAV